MRKAMRGAVCVATALMWSSTAGATNYVNLITARSVNPQNPSQQFVLEMEDGLRIPLGNPRSFTKPATWREAAVIAGLPFRGPSKNRPWDDVLACATGIAEPIESPEPK